ncbi:MAG: Na+/H+ antiporter subunit E [Pseudonocardia sp.]
MAERRGTAQRPAAARLGAATFLLVVWVLLWGGPSWVVVLGGAVLALALVVAFPQPPMPLGVGRRPGRVLAALGWVLWDICSSTVAVAWAAIRTGPATRAELVLVEVPACDSDVLVLTACLISISPGSVVVEMDTERMELLVHVLPVHDLERSRRDVARSADRLVRALRGPR